MNVYSSNFKLLALCTFLKEPSFLLFLFLLLILGVGDTNVALYLTRYRSRFILFNNPFIHPSATRFGSSVLFRKWVHEYTSITVGVFMMINPAWGEGGLVMGEIRVDLSS